MEQHVVEGKVSDQGQTHGQNPQQPRRQQISDGRGLRQQESKDGKEGHELKETVLVVIGQIGGEEQRGGQGKEEVQHRDQVEETLFQRDPQTGDVLQIVHRA